VDLEVALKFVNNILSRKIGRDLRPPEITILQGTWQGMTYEQMANSSSYSANYLMRDIAPKFWKSLSEALEVDIGKNNFRIEIEKLYGSSQGEMPTTSLSSKLINRQPNQQPDWANAPTVPSFFYGYKPELETLKKWLITDKCRILGLWGLSGMGKTLLMKKLAEQIQAQYQVVIWRSLALAPTLKKLLGDLLESGFGIVEKDETETKLLSQLIAQMREQSCLILLDGMEAILQPQAYSGSYLPGYEDYGEFFQVVGASSHQSCVVTTSLENFGRMIATTHNDFAIRNLKLSGLAATEAKLLLKAKKIVTKAAESQLIEYYQGNPAILTFTAQIIRELFNGNATEFLGQKSLVFGEINCLLSKSFCRLSVLEREILYWLASEPQPMTLAAIQEGIPFSIYPVELIEALESLIQRSLIEPSQRQQRSVFVLSPMLREFITNQFIAQIGNNFSIANRQNPLLNENTIELGQSTKQITHLSQWLQHRFELGWQPVDVLFAASARSPARLRSAFNLRGEAVISRFKQIDLSADDRISVLLLIAISPEDSAIKICVQAQPVPQQQTLPANLQLKLKDANNTVLATIQAAAQDNFIQLPYFRGMPTEKFQISLDLNSDNYEEDFEI
jgi:hypothetical protein